MKEKPIRPLPKGSEVMAYLPPGVHPTPDFILTLARHARAKGGALSEEEVVALMTPPTQSVN